MPYQKKNIQKTSSSSRSVGEDIASKKGLSAAAVPALQRQAAEEEEPLQGKFAAQLQAMEEEEPLQGKFDPVQRMGAEEEEPLQGKFATQLQAMEEEEPLQGKFEPVQRMEMEEEEGEEALQGKFPAQLQAMDEEEPLQGKFKPVQRMGAEEEEPLQGKFVTQLQAPEEEALQGKFTAQRKENNTGLPGNIKSGVENLSGMNLSDVKVHYNSSKPAQLNALAYAQGNDIHVGSGQEQHLAHEAWHVVQQRQGRVKPTLQMKGGVPVNDDKGLEHEADVMGAKAAQVGSSMLMQQKAQTSLSNTSTTQLKPVVQREFDINSIAEAPGKKGEGEEFADSFVDTYSSTLSTAGDFLGASPLTYTNSSNTKLDDDGNRVVDEDKVVVKGHKSDPLGKGASAAAVGFGVYSGIFGMYQAIQKFREGEVNDKIEGVFSALSSTSTMVKSGSDVAKTTSKEGSKTAKEAGAASSIAGTVTDGLDAVKTLVLTIKGIYDAYQDATSAEGSSSKEKLETGMATVRGLVEAAGKAVSMGKTIADMLQAGSAGLASAVPGLGIALSSIDIAIGIYNLIKAKSSESFVKEQLKKNMWEVGGGTFKKGKEGRKQRDTYVATFETELAAMKTKREALVAEKAELAKDGKSTKAVDDKIKSLDESITLGEKQFAALQENNALTHLKGVNQDRKYNAGFEIGVNMVKIVGDVLSLVPEPGSQVASMSLKLIAGGTKVAKGLGSKIIQWGRDKAAGKSDSALNKIFDSTKSSDAVKERNKGTVKYIFTMVKALPEDAESPEFKSKATMIEGIISSTGCDPNNLYRTVSDKGINEGVQLLFKSLGK